MPNQGRLFQDVSYVFSYSISGRNNGEDEYIFSGKVVGFPRDGFAEIQIDKLFFNQGLLPSLWAKRNYLFPIENLNILEEEE